MAEQPKIYPIPIAKSVAQAATVGKAHVDAVNAAAGNSSTSGAGATIVSHGKGQNK